MFLLAIEEMKLTAKPGVQLILTKLSHFLAEEGVSAYLVGGFVRDILLGRDTADIDIAVADALEIAPRVAGFLGGKYILLDEANGISRVVLTDKEDAPAKSQWEIDFSTLRGSIEQDLAQRDFTIDAMAIELGKKLDTLKIEELIDPFKGQHDLRQGMIRAVSDSSFKADPARLLRAVRLAAELGFSIDHETEALIQRDCALIDSVAGERVREELLQILSLPQAGKTLTYLADVGLLTLIIPELAEAKGIDQPTTHFWDVFDHSLKTVAAVEFLLRQGGWEYADMETLAMVPWSPQLKEHFNQEISSGSTRGSLLKLAALLHDIAKPRTKTVDEDGRARFLGHANEGASVAIGVLERLRFSNKEIKLVELMVQHHLRPQQMSNVELPTRRAIYRYFRDTGDTGIDILFLSLADHLAARGPELDIAQWQEHTQLVEYVLTQRFKEESPVIPPKLIDGHDLIKIFGLSPGPEIGRILEAVREAQAAGEVGTRPEAVDYTKYLLSHPEAAIRQPNQERNG